MRSALILIKILLLASNPTGNQVPRIRHNLHVCGLSPVATQKILQVSTKLGQFESFMLELDNQGYDISVMKEDMEIFAMTFFVSSEYPDDRILTISETDSD